MIRFPSIFLVVVLAAQFTLVLLPGGPLPDGRGSELALPKLAVTTFAAKKKKKDEEPVTQTHEILPDPPPTIKAETGRMVFHNSPLTSKGLLSQQVRDGVKAIWRVNGGATIVKLRALVSGTGDLRRVQAIVSEMFTEKKLPLPVVSTIQVGGLPMEGAQVILEATSLTKKPVNPQGLAFISGKGVTAPITADAPHMKVAPLAVKSLADLKMSLDGIGVTTADVLRVTCFLSSLEDHRDVQQLAAGIIGQDAPHHHAGGRTEQL